MDTAQSTRQATDHRLARRVGGGVLLLLGVALVGLVWVVTYGFEAEYAVLGRSWPGDVVDALAFGTPFLAVPLLLLLPAWLLHRRLAGAAVAVVLVGLVGVPVAGLAGVEAKEAACATTRTCSEGDTGGPTPSEGR